jgi:hypothetical protein
MKFEGEVVFTAHYHVIETAALQTAANLARSMLIRNAISHGRGYSNP